MAVAEKTSVAGPLRSPHQRLLISSSLAALYVIASFGLVFMGLPLLWQALDLTQVFNEFLADALLILVTLPTIFGLIVLGKYLEGPNPPRGSRAGAAFICFSLLVGGLLATVPGSPLWNAIGLVVLIGAGVLLLQPGFTAWLAHFEELGWFHATAFKPSQGVRVRRATIIGILVTVIFGIFTLYTHGTLKTGQHVIEFAGKEAVASDPWIVSLPFSDMPFVFLFRITLTVPILLLVGAIWTAWRVVNWPAFADFLIATEAELNKVSWTTRKRLYQDTIVVLVTVVLFTIYLFFVDVLWIKILHSRFLQILQYDTGTAVRKHQEGAQW